MVASLKPVAHAGNVKLLVVDDNPAQRTSLTAVLSDLDVTLVEAESGRDALRCLLREEFAIILLDVNMPGLDGFETAALIRARPSSEHTPIIFLTAYDDDIRQERGYSLGAVDYISTPAQPNVLRAKISVFLELYRKTEEVKRQREALRRYAMQLEQLSHASVTLSVAKSVEEMLEVLVGHAQSIIGAQRSRATAMLADRRSYVTASVAIGEATTLTTTGALPTVAHDPWRLTSEEIEGSAEWRARASALVPPPTSGWLGCPLTARDGQIFGCLHLVDKAEGVFTVEDEGILVQLAQMASVAIENTHAAEDREANRLKDEFLGVLSHELRTPLQAILTWISILRRESPAPGLLTRGLDVIERGAHSQVQLIGDLLDVSRVIRGELKLDLGPVDLPTVIDLAIESLKPLAASKQIEIDWTPGPSSSVDGDAARLQQVVWNLASNAIKFTPSGGRIGVQLVEDAASVQIRVSDTGCGISDDFLPFAFDRFRQANSSSSRMHGGLGLGLAIVRHLVELHRGTVRAQNLGIGKGALFTVTLPLKSASAQVHSRNAPPTTEGLHLNGIRVVLVEDEADAREALTTALELFGAEVVAVGSAGAALRALERQRPDVLLSDIGMPEEDGYSLIRKVRAGETDGRTRLPAAAVTAYARIDDRNAALTAGFDTHVQKPVEPCELAKVVQRLAGRA